MTGKKQLTIEQMVARLKLSVILKATVHGQDLDLKVGDLAEHPYFQSNDYTKYNLVIVSANQSHRAEEVYQWDSDKRVFKLWFMYTCDLPTQDSMMRFWCSGHPINIVQAVSESIFPDDPPFVKTASNAVKSSHATKSHRTII